MKRPDPYKLMGERQVLRQLVPFAVLASLVGLLVARSAFLEFEVQSQWYAAAFVAGSILVLLPMPLLA